MPAKRLEVEVGRNLIMLDVSVGSVNGDRTLSKFHDDCHQMALLRLGIAFVFLGEALRQQLPDLTSDQPVGDLVTLKQAHRQ